MEEVKNILKSARDNDTKISQVEDNFEVDDSLTDVQLGLIKAYNHAVKYYSPIICKCQDKIN